VLMFSGGSTGGASTPKRARLLDVLDELQAAKAQLNRLIKAP